MKQMNMHNKGSMLIAVIIAIMIFGAIGAGIASLVVSGFRSGVDHALSIQAFYMAESGFEWAAAELQDAHNSGQDWKNTCNGLSVNFTPRHIPNGGYFDITDSGVSNNPNGCEITILGLTENAELNNASSSRRLTATIRKKVIQGNAGDTNIFDNENDWKGGGANVDFDNGAMILKRPGGGQGETNTKADATDIIKEQFTSGDTIFFVTDINWEDTPIDEVLSIELKIKGQADINCNVTLPSLGSDCPADAGPLHDQYNLVVELGDNIDAADINKITIEVDWGSGDTEEVILKNGCIGTEQYCLSSGNPQDPVGGGTWQEG